MKFGINGFGRIGRCILRALFERQDEHLQCIAINCGARGNIQTFLHLLKYDSTYGIFNADLHIIDQATFSINGQKITMLYQDNPQQVPWGSYGIDVVMECSGKFTRAEDALLHLEKGAKKVLISAPATNADATIVLGVNEASLKSTDRVISIGSCTTNCLAPIVKVLNDTFTIKSGFMTTIHAYTNDQVLLDGNHKDLRRARSACASIIPTSTGAARSLGLVIPQVAGKIDGSAMRVPTSHVSVVEFTATTEKPTTIEAINTCMRNYSENQMKHILGYNDKELVSIDFHKSHFSSIFDSTLTNVVKDMCKVVAWYDNEWGFANRMLDVCRLLS